MPAKSIPFLKGRRMRVFAGPNGSGKSTIFDQIQKSFDIGYYVNPDLIESELKQNKKLDLSSFGLTDLNALEFQKFIEEHSIIKKAYSEQFEINLQYDYKQHSILNLNESTHSYEASLLADFIRIKLIERGKKLTFETVMSHASKLDIFDFAAENGYKTYLYFICTQSSDINIDRVAQRVQQGGHNVDTVKIKERYKRTLQLLKPAAKKTYRTFIWDNSKKQPELILEIENGIDVTQISNYLPAWVNDSLLKI
jgi:predicted ABC-type ATPase